MFGLLLDVEDFLKLVVDYSHQFEISIRISELNNAEVTY
jgi:hypothetical protein